MGIGMDTLYFKEDWAAAKESLTGWWNHEIRGRWALGVRAPRANPLPFEEPPPFPADPREKWLDYRTNHTHKEAFFSAYAHYGIIYPENTAYLGPGSLNIFLGTPVDFQDTTTWYREIYEDPAEVEQLQFDRNGAYWKWTAEALEFLRERAAGRYVVTMPDLIEGLDTLAELFGTQELLMHLLDCPDDIHRLLDQLDDLYFEAYDPLAELIRREDGSVPYMAFNAWGPGRTAKVQCDFSAMISPDMYDEFVLPHIRRQCQRLDYAVYHLDGPDAIRHLDSVLTIPELNALQWEPGAGQPRTSDPVWWDRIWKKVYASGKSAFLHGAPIEQVEPFVKEFGTEGTLILTATEDEDTAKRLMDDSLNW
ncbi:hypothetical protein [Kiritimatiella glycovorans]|nr:hypothetical protein [Kiritimatiella glycovorans]